MGGIVGGQGVACGSIDGLLCPGLGGGPVGGAGVSKFDGGFAGGFVLGEGLIELGEDFGTGSVRCGFKSLSTSAK